MQRTEQLRGQYRHRGFYPSRAVGIATWDDGTRIIRLTRRSKKRFAVAVRLSTEDGTTADGLIPNDFTATFVCSSESPMRFKKRLHLTRGILTSLVRMKPLWGYPCTFNRTSDRQQYEVGVMRSAYAEAEHLTGENVYNCAQIYKGSFVADKRGIARPYDVWSYWRQH